MNLLTKLAGLSLLLLATAFPVFAQIQAGSAVDITISGVPDQEKGTVNNRYPVSSSGMINMPHIGQVRAAGLMPDALASRLEAEYKQRKIYRNPTIQVLASSTQELDQQVVHVGGYVRQPGKVKFTQGLTLYQALQEAKGATEFGSLHRVTLYRNGKANTYDLKSNRDFWSVQLRPNDTIDVPQKNPFTGR